MACILVVDDSAFTRNRIKSTLGAAGFETLEADSGLKCLSALDARIPDCIVLDLNMPEMNGFEVLEHLKETGSKIPVIMCSADLQESSRERCMELGARDMITKPPKKDQLLAAIASVLEGATQQ